MQTKVMRPQDIKKYCNINPQAIREGLKAGKLDIGFAVKKEGSSRWAYFCWEQAQKMKAADVLDGTPAAGWRLFLVNNKQTSKFSTPIISKRRG